jgi:glycosyltransferase involved in cell wall biosynthesis
MKLSIITPTHTPIYLLELYESILSQTHSDWEWILYLNGGLVSSQLPQSLLDDDRVKIHVDLACEQSRNVGYLKNRAFHLGTGEALLEVDHDDILTPDCLAEVALAFSEDPEIGFVYSDNAKLADSFTPYSSYYGWTFEKFDWKDRELISMNSFPADSGALSLIFYAPDHIRAWRRNVYVSLGGHDSSLSVLDDQELMIRTYLITKFRHIKKTLYIYRIHGENTWIQRNKEIQDDTYALFLKWQQRLAEREADLRGLRKIDIGGGLYGMSGYETVDIRGNCDIIADLTKPWPFEDGEIGVINASHVIEHLPDKHFTMSEIHRVLAHGSWAFIEVPSTDGRGAFQDPTHVSYWNENSFFYYTRREQAQFIYNDSIKFQARLLETKCYTKWMQDYNVPCTRAWLRAIKDGHTLPGENRF